MKTNRRKSLSNSSKNRICNAVYDGYAPICPRCGSNLEPEIIEYRAAPLDKRDYGLFEFISRCDNAECGVRVRFWCDVGPSRRRERDNNGRLLALPEMRKAELEDDKPRRTRKSPSKAENNKRKKVISNYGEKIPNVKQPNSGKRKQKGIEQNDAKQKPLQSSKRTTPQSPKGKVGRKNVSTSSPQSGSKAESRTKPDVLHTKDKQSAAKSAKTSKKTESSVKTARKEKRPAKATAASKKTAVKKSSDKPKRKYG